MIWTCGTSVITRSGRGQPEPATPTISNVLMLSATEGEERISVPPSVNSSPRSVNVEVVARGVREHERGLVQSPKTSDFGGPERPLAL
jgi:hypothetical protein